VKALVKTGRGSSHLELRKVDEPTEVAPQHVMIRVTSAGVCGTDLHIRDDEYPSEPPVILGHEVGGYVERIGPGVAESWINRRVVTESFFSTCGVCTWCRRGRTNLCQLRRSIGSHVDGGMAELLVVPASNLHPAPSSLDDHTLALVEPLACVCNALCSTTAVLPTDEVLVLGPGAVGIMAAQVARACGGRVVLAGLPSDAPRLALAEALGVRTVTLSESVSPSPSSGVDFDVVVECSGSQQAIVNGVMLTKAGGRYVQMGLSGRPVTIPFDQVCYREIRLSGGFASTPRSWDRALRLIEDGLIQLTPMVTEVASLDDWERVLARAAVADGVKLVFDPRL
jgi:L-iditol 2-dehydrogenase